MRSSNYTFLASLGKLRLITNAYISNRPRPNSTTDITYIDDLYSGKVDSNVIYMFTNENAYSLAYHINKQSVIPVRINNLLLLIPLKEGVNIPEKYISVPVLVKLTCVNLTDDNWENGILRNEHILLFESNALINYWRYDIGSNLGRRQPVFLKAGNNIASIISLIQLESNPYLALMYIDLIDGDIQTFAFPNELEFLYDDE